MVKKGQKLRKKKEFSYLSIAKNQKILITDDSTFMRIIIKKLLAENGYLDIVEAENGRGAIDVFEKEKPDLTILDIIMPAMGGDVVLKKLMKMNKNAKIIMITAVGQEEIMEECNKVGASGYIKKPFKEKKC